MIGVSFGIVTGLVSDVFTQPYVAEVHAETKPEVKKEVKIEITYTKERIIELIKETFPEAPNTAVAIFTCESELKMQRSKNKLSYGQEKSFGIVQAHEPDWGDDAIRLGLTNWKKDVRENLKLGRYIYDVHGQSFSPWTEYRTGHYKTCL